MKGEMKLCGWIKRESNCIDEIRSGVSFSNNRNDAKWEWQFKMKNDAKWEGQSEYALFLIFFFLHLSTVFPLNEIQIFYFA